MQKMSGSDIALVIEELKGLEGKRIAKIRKTPEGLYLFKIGDSELLFEPGIRLHLTRQALQATKSPDGFVAFLRKRLCSKPVKRISQHDTDRIVQIEAGQYRLIFEVFRRGNIILADEKGAILCCLLDDAAGGRQISKGKKYCFPKPTGFKIKKPAKKRFSVQENEKGEPMSFSSDASTKGKEFGSFCEAADFYYSGQTHETDQQKQEKRTLKKLKIRLESQKNALSRIAEEKQKAAKAGKAVYSNYGKIEGILSLVRQMKKAKKSDEDINKELAKHKARVKGTVLEIEL